MEVSTTPRPLYQLEGHCTPCTGGWVGPKAGLDGSGKSCPTGIRSPDLPARSESLYRLSYPGRQYWPVDCTYFVPKNCTYKNCSHCNICMRNWSSLTMYGTIIARKGTTSNCLYIFVLCEYSVHKYFKGHSLPLH